MAWTRRAWRGVLALGMCVVLGGLPFACGDGDGPVPASGGFVAPPPRGDLSPEERRIVDEVVGWQTLDHHVYVFGLEEPLAAGTVVAGGPPLKVGDEELAPPALPALTEASWFFLIDDDPQRFYGHPLRYALLGVESQEITVVPASFAPLAGGTAIFPEATAERLAPPYLVYTTFAELPEVPAASMPIEDKDSNDEPNAIHVPCASGGKPRRYAVIVSGGGDYHERLTCSLAGVYQKLDASGFGTILATDGATQKDTALSKFLGDITGLAGRVECCDEVFVYVIAHGGRFVQRNGKWFMCQENGVADDGSPCKNGPFLYLVKIGEWYVRADDLRDALKQLNACHISVVIESCFGGGFHWSLDDLNGVEHSYSSCRDNELTTLFFLEGDKGCTATTDALLKNWDASKLAPGSDFSAGFDQVWAKTKKDNPSWWTDTPVQYDRTDPCACCGDGQKNGQEQCDPIAAPPECPEGQYCDARDCECRESGDGGNGGGGGGGGGEGGAGAGGGGGAGGACPGIGDLCDIVAAGFGVPPQPPGAPPQPPQQLWKGNCCAGQCAAGCNQGGEPGTCQGPTAQGICVASCMPEDCSFTSCLGCY